MNKVSWELMPSANTPLVDAFLGASSDDLFVSVATFAGAVELATLDVAEGQLDARRAINTAIANALLHRPSPGSRIALVKGEAGSGKSHILTTTFKQAAAVPANDVYPAVLQLTAPVATGEYDKWLVDAAFRQLTARHFADQANQAPLRRLAERLLERVTTGEREEFLRQIEDVENDEEIPLAKRFAAKIRREATVLLSEAPPSEAFIAVILLAGFGNSSAIDYLRFGVIERRLRPLGLHGVQTPGARIAVLRDLGLTAQIVGASLALGFDQIENAVRLGDEGLFVHALVQAVRLAEAVVNCSISIAVVADEYDRIVGDSAGDKGLPDSDRDRIEREAPRAVRLDRGSPDFLEKVIARRLAVMRDRARLLENARSLEPLPSWFVPRIREARTIRLALREASQFRERAVELGRIPTKAEYSAEPVPPDESLDFDKLWADYLDVAPTTLARLLISTKAELIAWWANEASREYVAGDPSDVAIKVLDDSFQTPVIDIVLKAGGSAVDRRQVALCEVPNRDHKLAKQIDGFLEGCAAVPAVLRTNGFPKGRNAQAAPAIRRLEGLKGLKLDLSDTEWHILQRARDFALQYDGQSTFIAWRRDCQWLIQLMQPLSPLIALPGVMIERVDEGVVAEDSARKVAPIADEGNSNTPPSIFPVLIGHTPAGDEIMWDPYRAQPSHLNNFGFLVTGDAGAGKTQTIRVLIDAACKQDLSVCIFDFKADYCDQSFVEPLGIEVVDVRTKGLPFNPLQPPPGGPSGVQPTEHAYEMASVLGRVFNLGPIQQGLLRDAINSAYQESGIAPREWVNPSEPDWPIFDRAIEPLRKEPRAAALVTKLAPLSELGLFPRTSMKGTFADFINKRVTLKLSDLPTDEIKSALAEIIIIQLHGHALRGEQPRLLKRMLVFDEAHRVRNSRRLEALAREGRAFGVGIVIGTQFPGDIPETMAGNLATQLFLMNNQAEHRRSVVKQVFGTTSGNVPRQLLDSLSRLRPLEGLFTNPHHQSALLRVVPHFERQ